MTNALAIVMVTCTAYCACPKCCGKWSDGITASGARVRQGRTAAANWLPFGTIVQIPGMGARRIEDRMSRRFGDRIDIYFDSHREALRWGIRRLPVSIPSQHANNIPRRTS